MSIAPNPHRRILVLTTACALVAGVVLTAPQGAIGVGPCQVTASHLKLKSSQRFAAASTLKRYRASVDYPIGTAYDQKSNVLLATYPAGAEPTLLTSTLADRTTTGGMVKAQRPKALAAINGDFFLARRIEHRNYEIARGPMVRDGVLVSADRQRSRAIGVDTLGNPFAGSVGVRGSVYSATVPAVTIQGVNWYEVQPDGATVYTTDWTAATRRPAGAVEWVIDDLNRIAEIRTSTFRPWRRGEPVAVGTRVVAFADSAAVVGAQGLVGQRAHVVIRQTTSTGVTVNAAVGRGAELVDQGVAAPLGCDAYSYSRAARPRTVIGWTRKGVWRTMTIPGVTFTTAGLRDGGLGLAMESVIAERLGLFQAYELDGGGSTTLYTRSHKSGWTRRDLFGVTGGNYEREVPNALAFTLPAK